MAENLFTRAAAYRKKHPSVSQAEAVQILARQDAKKPAAKKKSAPKKKPQAVGKTRKKTTVSTTANKVQRVKIRVKKNGTPKVTIGKPSQAKTWGKDRIHKYAADSGLRLVHGYKTEGRATAMSGISMEKIKQEHTHQSRLTTAINKLKKEITGKGLTASAKAAINREIAKLKEGISASKKHVNTLKKSL